jgi:hypothetical protein
MCIYRHFFQYKRITYVFKYYFLPDHVIMLNMKQKKIMKKLFFFGFMLVGIIKKNY